MIPSHSETDDATEVPAKIEIILTDATCSTLDVKVYAPNLTVAINMLKQALRETEFADQKARRQVEAQETMEALRNNAISVGLYGKMGGKH